MLFIWILLESFTLSIFSVFISSFIIIIISGFIESYENVEISGRIAFLLTFITAILMNFYLLFDDPQWSDEDLFISVWFKLSFYFIVSFLFTLITCKTKNNPE